MCFFICPDGFVISQNKTHPNLDLRFLKLVLFAADGTSIFFVYLFIYLFILSDNFLIHYEIAFILFDSIVEPVCF